MSNQIYPKRSPWGKVQSVKTYCDGVVFVSTASHGGFKVDKKRNAMIPPYMRSVDGWYEEDTQWVIPAIVFQFNAFEKETNPESHKKNIAAAMDTLKNWYPQMYEKFTGTTLQPGESFVRDEQIFKEANKDNYVVFSAISVDNGMVKVYACRMSAFGEKVFLIPAVEYQNRGKFSFVIDLERHQEITE